MWFEFISIIHTKECIIHFYFLLLKYISDILTPRGQTKCMFLTSSSWTNFTLLLLTRYTLGQCVTYTRHTAFKGATSCVTCAPRDIMVRRRTVLDLIQTYPRIYNIPWRIGGIHARAPINNARIKCTAPLALASRESQLSTILLI